METFEKICWVIASAAAVLYMGDYAATHLPPTHIPQVNATDSKYIWVPIPRLFPPFPSPVSIFLLGVVLVSLVISIYFEIHDAIMRRKSFARFSVEKVPVELELEVDPEQEKGKRLQYQAKVRQELPRLRKELDDTKRPKKIEFNSWNKGVDHELKPRLIHDEPLCKALEKFSNALNERNDYLDEKGVLYGQQHPEFLRLNQVCIDKYQELRKLGFVG
jgi:hypothetical protein